MAFYTRAYVERPDHVNPVLAVSRIAEVYGQIATKRARIWAAANNAWIGIEHLGFFSMRDPDESASVAEVNLVARVWSSETVMIAAHSTASCAAYARFASGKLVRFLSAGDAVWFESFGTPESWERDLLGVEPQGTYLPRSDATFSVSTIRRVALRLMLPNPEDAICERLIG